MRLDPKTEALLRELARRKDVSKSEVIREAIAAYGAKELLPPTAAELWGDVIGIVDDLPPDLSQDTGRKVAEIVRKKHAREKRRNRRP